MKSRLDYLKYNRRRTPSRGAHRLLPERPRRWLPYLVLAIVCVAALVGLAAAGNWQLATGELQTAASSQQLATSEWLTATATQIEAIVTAMPPTTTPIPSATPVPTAEGVVATF